MDVSVKVGDGTGVEAVVAIQEVAAVRVAVVEEVEVIDQVEETVAVVAVVGDQEVNTFVLYNTTRTS